MYAEIIEKLHTSNMKLFGVGVYALVLKGAYLLIHRNGGFYEFVRSDELVKRSFEVPDG